ncbi:Protein-tyrosine phosphatase, low molecular weight [Methanosalsum zhilinae DSM 4017]|uniref:Protein-tyrosine phosphatase, low molecular weight n=1 Tax=Methanosalsum zhilinae (strain DSM 4017 / NBRC 107636 / OCM 62 / WeN5) TaxID=679901 RepID=F7XN23_METZD|nr:protein-tyrosine-phosphatase [Methanosalsum zhilinae]AEH61133.1 Protein-tyrosine phosphatase, low molecular weight [Methanosalsum zhilinae DSM 4017]
MNKFLFVCTGNLQRSPTFEIWFKKNRPEYEAKSAGTRTLHFDPDTNQVNDELLDWADIIFCMDLEQHLYIYINHPTYRDKLEVIGVSDQYDRFSLRLIDIIEHWVQLKRL